MAAFGCAARCWREDPSISLGDHLEQAFQALDGLSAAHTPTAQPGGG